MSAFFAISMILTEDCTFTSYTYGEPVMGTVRTTTACQRHRYYGSVNPGCVTFNNIEVRLLHCRGLGTRVGTSGGCVGGGVGAGFRMRCTLPLLQVRSH